MERQLDIRQKIVSALGFVPTVEQSGAIDVFCDYMADRTERVLMILRGSAGTGKTTLAAALVKTLKMLRQRIVLLAPTGRAAKVFALAADTPAFTIHRRIYRQQSAGDLSGFGLAPNLQSDTIYLVDESSMIARGGMESQVFGTGNLLDDLVEFVYGGRNCRMILIGDTAQLPPVGEEESPALSRMMMEGYGLTVYEATLNEVLRQAEGSGILFNATMIRRMITADDVTGLPEIRFEGYADIVRMPGNELIDSLQQSYHRAGEDDTMVVTRSNKRAYIYNKGIRAMVLDREEELEGGDYIMIVRNNYHWTQKSKAPLNPPLRGETDGSDNPSPLKGEAGGGGEGCYPAFLANGDRARVLKVRREREFYGFRFADVTMVFPDYDDYELTATVLLDTLASEGAALTREQQEQLYTKILEDYADIPTKAERHKRLREDPYYNALQIKYAYAVTCHKAQGGQWSHVYVDQGYMTEEMLSPDYFHWLYTAFTRATEKLFLVNWP